MRVAVSTEGSDLEGKLDPRFGRAAGFLIGDLETMSFRYLDNAALDASGGAGIAAAQEMIREHVEAVITGHLGPNASDVMKAAGIAAYAGVPGMSAGENIRLYREGGLAPMDMTSARGGGQRHGRGGRDG